MTHYTQILYLPFKETLSKRYIPTPLRSRKRPTPANIPKKIRTGDYIVFMREDGSIDWETLQPECMLTPFLFLGCAVTWFFRHRHH
jgi:hypothetical protein